MTATVQQRTPKDDPLSRAWRVARAVATNQLAQRAPAVYVRLTRQTGRGAAAEEGAQDIAGYFRDCLRDYDEQLRAVGTTLHDAVVGRTLMEYGPGDLPGVAALMIAEGAERVLCVDRFPMVRLTPKNAGVVADLLHGTDGARRERLTACLADPTDPQAGFREERIRYRVAASGLSAERDAVDFVFSRAVLEHVDDLDATFADMVAAMKPGALALHAIDLRSHGLHARTPLDFLSWSPAWWRRMYSAKGVPNRWRVDRYRAILARLPVDVLLLEPTHLASAADVAAVRATLAEPFRSVSDEDLRWLGFWLVLRKRT